MKPQVAIMNYENGTITIHYITKEQLENSSKLDEFLYGKEPGQLNLKERNIYYMTKKDEITVMFEGEIKDLFECDNCGSTTDTWNNSSGELQCNNCGYSETDNL
jgi:hypothetical protein